ncbi:MAG: thiolase family protein, partial [Chloroflexota bacterium]
MKRYAVVGMGLVTGPQPGKTTRLLEAEAARLAIEDAGLDRSDIRGAVQLRGAGGRSEGPAHTDGFPRVLGLPVNFYYTIQRGGGLAAWGITSAMAFLELGIADYVVCSFGETSYSASRATKEQGRLGRATAEREGYWGGVVGDLRAASHHSFFASRHMHEYGTTSQQLGAIAVQSRQWAQRNPRARFYGRPITLEDYMNSPSVVEPYRLLDLCVVSDGGVGFVLTTEDRAYNHPNPPIWVHGIGFGEAMAELWWDKQNYTTLAVKTAKEQAFGQAGIGLADIDCAQLYDCFTSEVLFQMEDYGWCAKGEGGSFVASGAIGPGGSIPVNTSGGLLSAYHFSDLTGFSEAAMQLRGQAEGRQIPDCKFALVSGHGGEILSPGMCSMHSTLILGS